MKNSTKLFGKLLLTLCLPVAFSCSVDANYDLSKDIDMTVSVAEGLTIPLGSTEKIMLTELLDTLDSDVIKIDKETGFYSIEESGSIDATEFDVESFTIEIDPHRDVQLYDFNLYNLGNDFEIPDELEGVLPANSYAYVLEDEIDENIASFDIEEEVPAEVLAIKRVTFKNPVQFTVEVDVTLTERADEFSVFIDNLHIHTDKDKGFYVEVPEYVKFADGIALEDGNKLYIGELEEESVSKGVKRFYYTLKVDALDFSSMPDGELLINDGKLVIKEDDLEVYGALKSDTVFLSASNLLQINGVKIETLFTVGEIVVDSVYGRFSPEIDPVESWVDINIGDDLDNLNFEFTNPQLFVTIDNGASINVNGDVNIKGYKSGLPLDNAEVNTSFEVQASAVNNFYLSRLGGSMDGYTSIHIPNLNDIIRDVPERLKIYFEPNVNSSLVSKVQLGTPMSVKGSYRIFVPMEFESFSLEYTERIENVLGDNSDDITDYISDINSVTLIVLVDNTVPASFVPTIIAYKKDGVTKLDGIKVEVFGEIVAGNGYKDGKLTEPVGGEVAIRISATDGQLADLDIIDFVVKGSGSGALNANEYIQIKNMTLSIDKPIEVDMN